MKAIGIALLVILGLGAVSGVALFMAYQSLHDAAIETENQIVLLSEKSENVLSTTTIKIQDAAGIANIYAEDLKKVVSAAVEGRYGKDGSKATMQWIQEQNPTAINEKLYLKVQDIIDGGGSEFKVSQDLKMEYCKPYKDRLDYLVQGWLLKMAGFPKKDIGKLCQVISDKASSKAFDTGIRKSVLSK